jgi:hypothetical protein
MVVQGEHCGKYVRQVHHRYHEDNGKKQVIIILAVVKRVDGAADTLTGEQLELDPDLLCLAFKTTKDKKLNANLMNSLRPFANHQPHNWRLPLLAYSLDCTYHFGSRVLKKETTFTQTIYLCTNLLYHVTPCSCK